MDNTEDTLQENSEPAENTSKSKCFKSRKLKFIIPITIILILIISVCGIVKAQKKFGHGPGDGPGGFMLGMIVEKLNLTNDQKAQVEKIKDEIKAKMETKKDDRESMMQDFANEFLKDNMDKNRLQELDQKREQEMKENKDFMMDKMIEFHNLLTPEQRQKAVETMKEMKEKFKDHGGMDKNDKRFDPSEKMDKEKK